MNLTRSNRRGNSTFIVPHGLCELCNDISREVLRSQPPHLYQFILEHVRTLLVTRESTQVAVVLVNNVLNECKMVLDLLQMAGLTLEQIFNAMPRIQKAFLEYASAVDNGEGNNYEEISETTIEHILSTTGAKHQTANDAARLIQNALRLHHERILSDEIQGKLFLRRSLGNILNILKQAEANNTDISNAVRSLQHTYSGLYIRRNMSQFTRSQVDFKQTIEKNSRLIQAMQAVTWLKAVYEDAQWATERCNTAANVIQRAYRKYRLRKSSSDLEEEPITSVIVNAIFKELSKKVVLG